MDADRNAGPDDIAALKEALAVERAKGLEIAAELAVARAKASEDSALIVHQKLQIAKLRHQIYGQRSERSARLIEQLALALEELEADATEDVTRTLEVVPRQWKVIETVREKFSCRDCEKISQPPAPFHAVARGWAGPSLLAMIMFEKFGQHQPLNRQAERYALEGVPIALSTMADAV